MSRLNRHGSKSAASQVGAASPSAGRDDRITVALVKRAADDLQSAHERTRLSKTDIVNRALSLYEFVESELRTGAELIVRRDGEDQVVKLM